MDLEIQEKDGGAVINAPEEVAVIVQGSEGERIFLPDSQGSDSTYYVEKGSAEEFFYPGEISGVEIVR